MRGIAMQGAWPLTVSLELPEEVLRLERTSPVVRSLLVRWLVSCSSC